MAGILVIAEQLRGQVRDVSREAVAVGLGLRGALGGPVAVALLAPDPESLAASVDIPGVDELIAVVAPGDGSDVEVVAQLIETLIGQRRPTLVLAGSTVNGAAIGPRVAVDLGLGFASNVTRVVAPGGTVIAHREILGGKVDCELEFPDVPAVMLLLRASGTAADAGSTSSGAGASSQGVRIATTTRAPRALTRTNLAVDDALVRSTHIDYEEAAPGEIDLCKAAFVVSIGRGIGDRENIEVFRSLAERAGAQLGSSRPLVDAGWMPASRQVGQSGNVVRPAVYLAFGISGANEHVAGMKESGTIIAVNTDAKARIFDIAHFGAVADAVEVAEELGKVL